MMKINMTVNNERLVPEQFVDISAVLTGYSKADLYSTGCVEEYWHQFNQVMPEEVLEPFLDFGPELYRERKNKPDWVNQMVRTQYLANGALGPPARCLIQLWYLGQWMPLPSKWRQLYGASRFDVTRIISARAYQEGLVWDAIGAHPMGAKQQGFGAWSQEPPLPKKLI